MRAKNPAAAIRSTKMSAGTYRCVACIGGNHRSLTLGHKLASLVQSEAHIGKTPMRIVIAIL